MSLFYFINIIITSSSSGTCYIFVYFVLQQSSGFVPPKLFIPTKMKASIGSVALLFMFPFGAIGFLTLSSRVVAFRTVRWPTTTRSLISPEMSQSLGDIDNAKQNLWKQVDTLSAAGRDHPHKRSRNLLKSTSFLVPPIGSLGHAALFLLATSIVRIGKKASSSPGGEVPAGGMLDRCPWPFIFFHDPKQGLKDSSTWVAFLYLVLWRCLKLYQAAKSV
jgi:hypothetical protein